MKHRILSEEISEEQLKLLFDAGVESGAIAESEIEMINNIFEFDDKSVSDIATHRKDIVAFPIDTDSDSILTGLAQQKYSRIPVYEDNIDNIVGILHVKDVVRYIANKNKIEDINLRELIRAPYFVPVSKKTDELFREMSKKKVHMAVIIDEYGGTYGIVTMEDLIEEIMGSILDEYDDEETPDINKLDESTFEVNGLADLGHVAEYFDVGLPTDDYDTLGGFIVSQLGHIPADNEKPEFEFGGLTFMVNKIEENRVASAIVRRL